MLAIALAAASLPIFGAWAQGRPARVDLDYEPTPRLAGCPSEQAVRQALAAKLGYDPFAGSAEHHLEMRVEPSGEGIVGSFELRGPRSGRREIGSPESDCREVVDALVVAAAIAIDPAVLVRGPSEPPSSSSSPIRPAPPPPPPTTPAPTTSEPVAPPSPPDAPIPASEVAVVAGGSVLWGELPDIAPSIEAGGRLRVGAGSLALTGLMTSTADTDAIEGGYAKVSMLAFNLVPCGHLDAWSACLIGSLGALRAEGVDLERRQRVVRRSGALGALAAYDQELNEWLRLGVYTAVMSPVTRTTLKIDDRDVWTTSRLAGRLGGRLVFSF